MTFYILGCETSVLQAIIADAGGRLPVALARRDLSRVPLADSLPDHLRFSRTCPTLVCAQRFLGKLEEPLRMSNSDAEPADGWIGRRLTEISLPFQRVFLLPGPPEPLRKRCAYDKVSTK